MKKVVRNVEVQEILLGLIGAAGMVTLALLAPNAIQVLRILKKNNRHYRSPKYINETVQRLSRKGWIYFEGNRMRLTKKGEVALLKYQMREKVIEGGIWDGKWRMVIFDIKEKKKGLRNKVREDLKSFGFLRLQDSVWVYPYECEEVVALLKASVKIGWEVLYVVSEKIEGDARLKKMFNLQDFYCS